MTSSFDALPPEVLRSILSYMDISSLAKLSMTQKPSILQDGESEGAANLPALASDDTTWYTLIQRRFGIGCNHRRSRRGSSKCGVEDGVVLVQRHSSSSLSYGDVLLATTTSITNNSSSSSNNRKRRPTTYGGSTWKDAYCSLSSTMRIPETSLTSGATSGSGSGGAVFASPRRGRRSSKQKEAADYLGVWCLVNHAENCRVKTVESLYRRRGRGSAQPLIISNNVNCPSSISGSVNSYNPNKHYLEIKLCLQNTKSGYGSIAIPSIRDLTVASLEEEEYFEAWGWDKWTNEYESTFEIVQSGVWGPKLLLRRQFSEDYGDDVHSLNDSHSSNILSNNKEIVLRPFETVVLSIHISCPSDMVYETDVLSTLSCIRVPVFAREGWQCTATKKASNLAVAEFLDEDLIWDYYVQLPGGCMSLIDRSQLVPM
jgi:hypothetical protein